MIDNSMERPARWHRFLTILGGMIFIGLCLGPHLTRLGHPSLFADDVTRIRDLQTRPMGELLFRPIQEHMAPLFETISWITWQLAGRRLIHSPTAFSFMAFLPFLLCLWVFLLFLRRELGSTTTALVAVATFSLSSLYCEVIYWYSASSFSWALFWTLVALYSASSASRSGDKSALGWSVMASAMAPACSAIGLLAGPLAAIRLGSGDGHRPTRLFRFHSIAPTLGTFAYLAVCAAFHYQDILSKSVESRADFGSGMIYVLCAPTNVLLPGLLGLNHLELGTSIPLKLNLGLAALALIGLIAWAYRCPHRSLVVGGLWLVLCGYTVTYCFRTTYAGAPPLYKVERYHFFPLVGFVFWTALASRRWLIRYDRRPLAGLVLANVVATLMVATHLPSLLAHSRSYDFPHQRQALAALERLEAICRRERITRGQAMAALGTIHLKWSVFDYLGLLPPTAVTPRISDQAARQTLMASLSITDRESIWGGMDASPYLRPAGDLKPIAGTSDCRLVASSHVGDLRDGRCNPAGSHSYLEFEMPDQVIHPDHVLTAPRFLAIPSLYVAPGNPGRLIEVWWAGVDGEWSSARSLRWKSGLAVPPQASAVSLDHLPHLDPVRVRRVRIVFRTAGQVMIDPPQFLR